MVRKVNYKEIRFFLENLTQQKGMVFGLENMETMLKNLSTPYDIPTIQVAGTNGKGSVCTFITNIMISAGYKVGTYMSPAVGQPMEIIRIDGLNISEEDYSQYMSKLIEISERLGIYPTAFEYETLIALWYFADNKCDICIVETGLGGELDATNVISSTVVSVITSVGMDHMHILGNSLEDIAKAKSGIIKYGSVAVVAEQRKEVLDVMKIKADCVKADIVITGKPKNVICKKDKTRFNYEGLEGKIEIEQPGRYQVENSITAIEVANVLRSKGYNIEDEAILKGLKITKLPYRYETILNEPRIIIDGAHNENAVRRLVNNIVTEFGDNKVIFVMGIFKDKDYKEVIKISSEVAREYVVLTPVNARGLNSSELCETIEQITNKEINVVDAKNISNAALYVLQKCKKDDIIVAFGSLSYLDTFKREIERQS